MNQLEKNLEVFRHILDKCNNNINCILIGSTSLALQSIAVEANDLDILTDKKTAKKLDAILAEYCTKKLAWSPAEKYRSFYGKYKIGDVEIDVMANFQYKMKNGEWSKPVSLKKTISLPYKDKTIKLLNLEDELQEYEQTGRDERAEKIKDVLYQGDKDNESNK